MTSIKLTLLLSILSLVSLVSSFSLSSLSRLSLKHNNNNYNNNKIRKNNNEMKMFLDNIELNTSTYIALGALTVIPSILFVKFIGDAADSSKDNLSDETRRKFKKSMMENPATNLSVLSSEEEMLKKQIAKAYQQDKDVDVAILEEKLKKRAQWRKEMMTAAKANADSMTDEDGW